MKNKLRIGGVITSVAAGILLSSTVLAHEAGKANQGYLGNAASGNQYVTDRSGNCVRTRSWKEGDMTVDCGAAPMVEAKAPPPPPAPPPEPVYETTTLTSGALFAFDSDALKPEGMAALDAVEADIRSKGASVVDIDVVGHTDSVGPEAYNQQLSVRRATTVRDYIVSKGVNPNIIDVSGMGESSPVADNSTKAGRAQNRRVDVKVGVSQRVK
ncbi:MAG: OmpA family protein [Gammaproteobacteria bacterium]